MGLLVSLLKICCVFSEVSQGVFWISLKASGDHLGIFWDSLGHFWGFSYDIRRYFLFSFHDLLKLFMDLSGDFLGLWWTLLGNFYGISTVVREIFWTDLGKYFRSHLKNFWGFYEDCWTSSLLGIFWGFLGLRVSSGAFHGPFLNFCGSSEVLLGFFKRLFGAFLGLFKWCCNIILEIFGVSSGDLLIFFLGPRIYWRFSRNVLRLF